MERKNKLFLDLSGGMNTDNTPLTLKDNEAELIINYKLTRYGGLRKRWGMLDTGAGQEIGDYPILAIGTGNETGQTFIHTNGNIYEWAGSSWASRIASVGTAKPASFAYISGNDSGGTDPDGYTIFSGAGGTYAQSSDSGTTWSTDNLPASGDNFQPKIVESHSGRLYLSLIHI